MHKLIPDNELFERLIFTTDQPCVTVHFPTKKMPAEKAFNESYLKEMVKKSLVRIKQTFGARDADELSEDLLSLKEVADQSLFLDGTGLYVSRNVKAHVLFPFPVLEQVFVGYRFAIRNVCFLKQYLLPYFILVISQRGIALYAALADKCAPVQNDLFPMTFEDEYEYQRASLGTSYGYAMKEFERDKSEVQTARAHTFFQEAIRRLKKHLAGSGQGLVIAGAEKQVFEFERTAGPALEIIGRVHGHFSPSDLGALADQAWLSARHHWDQVTGRMINEISEMNDRTRVVYGAKRVWEAAREGRGQLVLLERDYYLKLEEDGNYVHGVDMIEDIIAMVLKKNGSVLFTEPEKLSAFDHIAMKLRY